MIRPSALGAGSPALELLVFNIFVKDLGERTKVRVNASFLVIRNRAAFALSMVLSLTGLDARPGATERLQIATRVNPRSIEVDE